VTAAIAAGIVVLGAGSRAGAVPTTFIPVADAYVNEASPGTNYGANTTLRVDGSPLVNSYLRFNVQGLGSPVISATLRIFANSSQTVGFNVHSVSDIVWNESNITYNNAPAIAPAAISSSGPVTGGSTYDVDVTSIVTGNGLVSFGLKTTHTTALSLASKESANDPQLIVNTDIVLTPTPSPTPSPTPVPTPTPLPTPTPAPTPVPARLTVMSRVGNTYYATSQWGSPSYSGTNLASVGTPAINDMNAAGGGTVQFEAGTFDFGTGDFNLDFMSHMVFQGAGVDVTILQNSSNASSDTEVWNMHTADYVTIRDMTVSAGGALRTTSDAIDFDGADHVVIERVKVSLSRARGIIFDGKDIGREANNNTIRDCIVTGVPGDGIELLAAENNHVENCSISNVGGHGIQVTKSSSSAATPNEKSNGNVITGNTISNATTDGINLISSDLNQLANNVISGSGRDGIRIDSSNSIAASSNTVGGNTSSNNLRWGLNIDDALCKGTIVGTNTFSGNGSGPLRNLGTGTIYQ
jgi:parallel beta-helix repeat protein